MRRPSKKVRAAFAEAEELAEQMLVLRTEELRLRELLEQVWRTRVQAMATLAIKADMATAAEVAEFDRRRS
jgi:uncharacterized lipoprotein YmbA